SAGFSWTRNHGGCPIPAPPHRPGAPTKRALAPPGAPRHLRPPLPPERAPAPRPRRNPPTDRRPHPPPTGRAALPPPPPAPPLPPAPLLPGHGPGPIAGPDSPTPLPACVIDVKEGCYRITFTPTASLAVFNGTLRVDRSGGQGPTTVSGDLYRFLTLPSLSGP